MNIALLAHATPVEWSLVLLSLVVGITVGVALSAWVRLRSRR